MLLKTDKTYLQCDLSDFQEVLFYQKRNKKRFILLACLIKST